MRLLSRRNAILGGAAAVGGLLLTTQVARHLRGNGPEARPLGGEAWLHITPDGTITVRSNVAEMGQGSQSGLLQALADELDADWLAIRVESAPVAPEYFGHSGHYTGGSGSIRNQLEACRLLGARARAMLLQAAARRWAVAASTCVTEASMVVHPPSGRRLGYGELAAEAALLPVPADVALKQPGQWRYIGRPMPRLDSPAKVDGSARFGIDVDLPGMKVAAVRHCPFRGGRLQDVDPQPALAVPGVAQVVRLADAVAVIAQGYWAAHKGADALRPEWTSDPAFTHSSDGLDRLLVELVQQAGGKIPPDAAKATAQGDSIVDATYQVPALAQAPLEPMNATAWLHEGRMEVWAPTQAARQCRQEVAKAVGLPEDSVTVHPQMMGGGFGRRLNNDYALEAALVARETEAPVKLIWSREEDFLRTSLRPASRARLQARLDAAGRPDLLVASCAALDPYPQTAALEYQPYGIARTQVAYEGARTAARPGYWRSVNHSHNVFFLESFIDECAARGQHDPLEYRRALLAGNPRGRAVLEELAALSGYRDAIAADRPVGLAYCQGFGSRAAVAVELDPGSTTVSPGIRSISCTADCGLIVNPASVEAQLQGGIFMALSAALHERVLLQTGRITTTSFSSCGIAAPASIPDVRIKLLDAASFASGGVGELAVPAVAPALANALFRSSGVRYRTLPLAATGASA